MGAVRLSGLADPERVSVEPLDRVSYLRTGPTRRGYTVAGLLWVAGLLIVFTSAYSMERELNERAVGYETVAVNETAQVTVDEPGSHTVWVDEIVDPAGSEASLASPDRESALLPARGLAEVALTDAGGSPVDIALEPSHEYRTQRSDREVDGLAWGTFDARPGTYELSVLSPSADIVGVAVGPTPSPGSIVVRVIGGLAMAVAGLVVLVVVLVRRSSTAKSFAQQG